jgi:hypothetical protein
MRGACHTRETRSIGPVQAMRVGGARKASAAPRRAGGGKFHPMRLVAVRPGAPVSRARVALDEELIAPPPIRRRSGSLGILRSGRRPRTDPRLSPAPHYFLREPRRLVGKQRGVAMAQGIQFTGSYDAAPLSSLIPGDWYLGFACAHCRRHFAILNEPTNTGALQISGTALFRAVCPECGNSAEYLAADLVQFQAAQGGPMSTA